MLRRRLFLCLLLLIYPAIANTAHAEPTRVPQWLMRESVSLFDWGIYKLDKKMEWMKELGGLFTIHYAGGSAEYDWDSDRIKLRFTFQGKGTEQECVDNLKKAKGALLNFSWDDTQYAKLAREVLAGFFSHEGGYKDASAPSDIGEQLANITTLVGEVIGPEMSIKIRCQTTLKSPEVSIIRS